MEDISLQFRSVIIETSNLFIIQNTRCPLWITCINNSKSFSEIAKEFNNNFEVLLSQGFNINFLTRKRWLDINVLVNCFGVKLPYLVERMKISQQQIESWRLTEQEFLFFSS